MPTPSPCQRQLCLHHVQRNVELDLSMQVAGGGGGTLKRGAGSCLAALAFLLRRLTANFLSTVPLRPVCPLPPLTCQSVPLAPIGALLISLHKSSTAAPLSLSATFLAQSRFYH